MTKTLIESLSYTPTELSFGTSGLRGLVTEITDLETYINTTGFITFMQNDQSLIPGSTIYFAGDLRDSTPRILASVYKAIIDAGYSGVFGGYVPTPAISYYGLTHDSPSIMVTGSHIPADRNGIKFIKLGGEVLKQDEPAIKAAVSVIRDRIYSQAADVSVFDHAGMLKEKPLLPAVTDDVEKVYLQRYRSAFAPDALAGKQVVFYQHSAVGRDSIPAILESLGASVERIERTDYFVPIDNENVTPDDQAHFKSIAQAYPNAFAIVSTDGDSDRPFVVDENGIFHRGDELGAIVASWLKPDFVAIPISSSDAINAFLDTNNIKWEHTRIGSPYVITAMEAHPQATRAVGWEVNGGFLLGTDITTRHGMLKALATRDAVLPIIVALISAAERDVSISKLFKELPERYTQAGIIDDFPSESSRAILDLFSGDIETAKARVQAFFTRTHGFGSVSSINTLDGIRIFFDNGDVAHIRPSGNAPQLRCYSVASTQARADEIVSLAIAEPDGIFRKIEHSL